MNKNVIILTDNCESNDKLSLEKQDTFAQAEIIGKTLAESGFCPIKLPFKPDLEYLKEKIMQIEPDFVFNLVEDENYIVLSPIFLECLKVKYTGCRSLSIHMTNDKLLFKKIAAGHNIFFPKVINLEFPADFDNKKLYIVKSSDLHSSVELNDDSVRTFDSIDDLKSFIDGKNKKTGFNFFAEEYVDGREFNISTLGNKILPPAEIVFRDYPKDKLKIVGFEAKWHENSFEYNNTIRRFDFNRNESELIDKLLLTTDKIRRLFEMNEYARFDYRVDKNNNIYILEINANPCLSPDAGFFAACERTGMTYRDVISKIVELKG